MDKIESSGHNLLALERPELPEFRRSFDLDHSHWLAVSQECDAYECKNFVEKIEPDWIIVDHYALDINWHKILKPICKNIMVIDDIADRAFDCKILVNQNLGFSRENYEHLTSNECKFLIGPKYSFLRTEFIDWRQFSIKRRLEKKINNVLVMMGG